MKSKDAMIHKHEVSSITYYLVKLLDFVHIKLNHPHAVRLQLVDMEKAFNRVFHQ